MDIVSKIPLITVGKVAAHGIVEIVELPLRGGAGLGLRIEPVLHFNHLQWRHSNRAVATHLERERGEIWSTFAKLTQL